MQRNHPPRLAGAARCSYKNFAVTIGLMPESSEKYRDSGWGRILILLALVLAVAAVGLSGWTLYRLSQTGTASAPRFTGAERADAKQKVCAAADLVRRGVSLNTNLQPAGGPEDVTGILAVAANARISLSEGGQYLLARLDPATSPELADAVKKFANGLMDIGAAATAGAQNSQPDQAARLRNADAANVTIGDLCK
jgi:hypothetical protein